MGRRLAKRGAELQLNPDASATAIADVVRVGSGKLVSVEVAHEARLSHRRAEFGRELVVESAYVNDFTVDPASVDGDNIVAGHQQFKAAGLVKVVARQVQRRVVTL